MVDLGQSANYNGPAVHPIRFQRSTIPNIFRRVDMREVLLRAQNGDWRSLYFA